MSSRETLELIARARDGDEVAVGELIARYRGYLCSLASKQLDSDVKSRVDPSDVVQQSCLEFHRDFHTFRGPEEGELIAWLKQILRNNVSNTIRRHVHAEKRSVEKECSLADSAGSGYSLGQQIAADQSSPSERARRGEAREQLERVLRELPDDQGEAIRLRYVRGWTLEQLAGHFDRSEMAAAGLLKRGLQTLRDRMGTVRQ